MWKFLIYFIRGIHLFIILFFNCRMKLPIRQLADLL
jgi:hypothetical protein